MYFDVTITETLQKKVTVRAIDQPEAEQLVQCAWDNAEHILDSGHFTDVAFTAEPAEHTER